MIWKPWGRSAAPSLYRGKLYPRHRLAAPGRVLRLLGTVCAFPGIVRGILRALGIVCTFAGIVCASLWDALRVSAPFSRLGDIPTPCARLGLLCASARRPGAGAVLEYLRPVLPCAVQPFRGDLRPVWDHRAGGAVSPSGDRLHLPGDFAGGRCACTPCADCAVPGPGVPRRGRGGGVSTTRGHVAGGGIPGG